MSVFVFNIKLPFMCERVYGEFVALVCMLIVGCPIEICCGVPQLSKVNLVSVLTFLVPMTVLFHIHDCSIPHSLFGALFINLLLLIHWIHCH